MKHAYLIIAHNNYKILEMLVKALDYELHDIYIHIDYKWKSFDLKKLKENVKSSKLFFLNKRKNVIWGSFKQINVELELLKASNNINYSYYHLLSGVDFPLKKNEVIYKFFEKNRSKEFIDFCKEKDFTERYKYYYFFTQLKDIRSSFFLRELEKISLVIQKKLG